VDRPNNLRLLRIAECICSCVLTDGFCGPAHKPKCRCWDAARAAVQGLKNQANPSLVPGWEVTHAAYLARDKADPRKVIEAVCDGILARRDELTKEHEESGS
jgi:hypothetical protein